MSDLTLTIVRGDGTGTAFTVPTGEERLIGREPPAGILFASDPFVSGRHAVVTAAPDGVGIRDLNSSTGTFVNDRRVSEGRMFDGDELRIGETALRVSVERTPAAASPVAAGAAAGAAASAAAGAAAGAAVVDSAIESAKQEPSADPDDDLHEGTGFRDSPGTLARRYGVADEFATVARHADDDTPYARVVEALLEEQDYPAAIRMLGHGLRRRAAVAWAIGAVATALGDDIPPEDDAHLKRAEAWVKEPSEANRRAAYDAVVDGELSRPSEFVAMGVGFSHGSIAPIGAPDVPADPKMSGRILAGVVEVACTLREPERADEHRERFIRHGLKLASDGVGEQLYAE